MSWLAVNRQRLIFAGLIVATVLATNWAYGFLRGGQVALSRARDLLKAGQLERSAALMEEARRRGVGGPQAVQALADLRLARRDFAGALPLYQSLRRLKPRDPAVAVKLAEILSLTGGETEAREILAETLRLFPQNPGAWLGLGALETKLGRWGKAALAYRRALGLAGQSRAALVGLGDSLAYGGQPGQAVQWYRRALAANAADRDARIRLARALSWQGKLEEAIEQYRIALGGES